MAGLYRASMYTTNELIILKTACADASERVNRVIREVSTRLEHWKGAFCLSEAQIVSGGYWVLYSSIACSNVVGGSFNQHLKPLSAYLK